jgi:hypothetical protein
MMEVLLLGMSGDARSQSSRNRHQVKSCRRYKRFKENPQVEEAIAVEVHYQKNAKLNLRYRGHHPVVWPTLHNIQSHGGALDITQIGSGAHPAYPMFLVRLFFSP